MEKIKYYGCKSIEDSNVKIVEEYITSDLNEIEYTAYFGSYDKGFNCFRNWNNYVGVNINLRIYVKISNNWIGVAYKHITKDNIDDTENQLKLLNISNMDML
jgi:hypothetical protein